MIKAEIFPDTHNVWHVLVQIPAKIRLSSMHWIWRDFTAKIGQCLPLLKLGIEAFEEMYVTYLFDYEVIDGKGCP